MPRCVPKCERDELFEDAVEHDETVLRVPADQLAMVWDGWLAPWCVLSGSVCAGLGRVRHPCCFSQDW